MSDEKVKRTVSFLRCAVEDPLTGWPWYPDLSREPADRTILRWMPVAYMEAARAGVGKPDALAVVEAESIKVGDAVTIEAGCWYCGSRKTCGCREEADRAIWGNAYDEAPDLDGGEAPELADDGACDFEEVP